MTIKIVFWSNPCLPLLMKKWLLIVSAFLCFSMEAQQGDSVDFKKVTAQLVILPDSTKVSGTVNYAFEMLEKADSIYIDAINMEFSDVFVDNEKVEFHTNLKKVWLHASFKKNERYNLTLTYVAYPKKALYFVKHNTDWQIWTQGQGKYTSHWLPSIDDMNDKMEFDLSIRYAKNYEVIGNGKLTSKKINDSTAQWHYDMKKPMSSYLVALAIGKYNKKELTSKSGTPIILYYYPEDSAKVEPTYRYTKEMFDFLEKEIGVSYPWQNYKQVPVKDFLYSGMENTSLTIFSDDFMIDKMSFIDKNYINVNAHELAHQWFGNLVTETEGKHHWLQEGFATYYALLAERTIFGDDYYYWQLYEYAQELLAQEKANQATALLDPKASSTTFYKKGAWALHMLKEKVGEKPFKKAVKNYLEKYAFKNVTTTDFITEVEKASGADLTAFVEQWLHSQVMPADIMFASLFKNAVVRDYELLNCHTDDCGKKLSKSIPNRIKAKIIAQKPELITPELFQKKDIKTRQVIAQHLTTIPPALKTNYESLLRDQSYLTVETALYNLWTHFPESRKKYLDQTQDVIGFNDKNVRTLWLVLALNTPDVNPDKKRDYYHELVQYTSAFYGFQLRQKAFSYLEAINVFNTQALENLIAASAHHNWRFKSFAQELLERLSEDERYEQIIVNLQVEGKN